MGSASERITASFVVDPPIGAKLLHYAAAMALVAAALAAVVGALARAPASDALSQMQEAVLVDLPPLDAGSHPQGDEAPTQQAAAASAGAEATPRPTQEPPDPIEPPKPAMPQSVNEAPQAPAAAAVLDKSTTPPPPTTAPASVPQEAHETGEVEASHEGDSDASDAETRRASARLITLWQKALMARLQTARHGLAHAGHDTGIVKVAFEIDRGGHLLSERVAHGSGSVALDAAALALVRRAAPYPTPPRDAGASQLSFVVPISFK